jgi:Tfp pilus assembly protein PilO
MMDMSKSHPVRAVPADKSAMEPASRDLSAANQGLLEKFSHLQVSSLLPFLRYGADRIGPAGIIGVALCFFALVASISATGPLKAQAAAQRSELDALRSHTRQATASEQGNETQQNARRLVDELPARNDLPQILGRIFAIASEAGLSLEKGGYDFSDSRSNAISFYRLSLPVRGSYPQVRRFIENTLASMPVIALERLRFDRSEVSDEIIAADLEFAVLVRNER